MKRSTVEDCRTIDLDVKCHAKFDGATPEARWYEIKEFRRPNLGLPWRGYIKNTLEMLLVEL